MFLATHGVLRRESAYTPPVLSDIYSFEYDGVADVLDLGSVKPSGAMTISYWFKGRSTGGSVSMFGNSGNSGSRGYAMGVNNASLWYFQIASSSTATKFTTYTFSNDLTKWYHLTGVYSPSNYVRLYIDGYQVSETTSGVPSSQYTGNSLTTKIGNRGDGGSFGRFIGVLDEPAIFDYAMTPAQVLSLYGTGVPTDISSLSPFGWWRAENGTWNGSNWSVTDLGSNASNATSSSMTISSRVTDVPT